MRALRGTYICTEVLSQSLMATSRCSNTPSISYPIKNSSQSLSQPRWYQREHGRQKPKDRKTEDRRQKTDDRRQKWSNRRFVELVVQAPSPNAPGLLYTRQYPLSQLSSSSSQRHTSVAMLLGPPLMIRRWCKCMYVTQQPGRRQVSDMWCGWVLKGEAP